MNPIEALFWVSAFIVIYVYVGYPVVLVVLRAILGTRTLKVDEITPSATMVISAFNEEAVIEEKLQNCLNIDYPADKLEILVVSDASDDATDEIVRRYAGRGIRLIRMTERGGKTLGLNEAVSQAKGEVVVFSDANAMYDKSALKMMVRNFAHAEVGAVVGESTYVKSVKDADRSESSYWQYEILIKRLESQLGSVVGGDGAIYAIRRNCYIPMSADALSDFQNPLQIVQQGLRCVYEPNAWSIEESAGDYQKEFRRKVRIVNRAWRATMRMKEMINPIKHGVFSLQLVSHKLLRWLVPIFLIAILLTNLYLIKIDALYCVPLAAQLVLYVLATAGHALSKRIELPIFLAIPYYFCLVNLASLKGIIEFYSGRSYTTWATARSD